uniref:Mos1 transposase HTH domain-containing protein n=1 Tax=Ditylenchus dipsaci TaxID=166011 RepID=A0A915DSJ0_9BILA
MRHCLLFLFDKDHSISAVDSARQLKQVYGQQAPGSSFCSKWLKLFREGKKEVDDLEDEPRTGRPSDFDDNKLVALVEEDPKLTIRELAPMLNCAHNTVLRHLHSIGKGDIQLDEIVTSDEKWVLYAT